MIKENQKKYLATAEQKEKINQSEKPKDIDGILVQSLENISQFEPSDKNGHLRKMLLRENISDVMTTLREGGEDSLNLLVAYRGLEQTQKQGSLQEEDFGVGKAMDVLREKIQEKEGFDIGEIEDLDQAFEKTQGDVKEAMRLKIGNISEEELAIQKSKFERYFSLKQEIQARQRQILGESKSFYRGISEKISGPLLEFLTEKGKKFDDKMKNSSIALLKYIGKYGMSSKLARGVGLSIITASALGFIFKGEITEAAQYENEASEDHDDKRINGWASLEELKSKNPEVYRLLEEKGFIKKAGIEYEENNDHERKKQTTPSEFPEIFKDASRETNAAKLLETDEYRNADNPQELKTLYDQFNEKDDDPSDDLAVAVKYNQFLQTQSKEKLVVEYGEQGAEKIFQEAGFVTFKALEKYFDKDIQDGSIDSESLKDYLDGFKKASEFYKYSLELGREYVKDGKLSKTFINLITMNNVLSNIANTAMIYGNSGDKLAAALMRNLIHENIKRFDYLKDELNIINLGNEKFLFLKLDVFQNVINENIGGMVIATAVIAKDVNEGIAMGKFSQQENDFIDTLADEKIIIKTKQGFVANPEKPYLLFSLTETYGHENRHYEFVKNDNLMKYWVNEWNAMSKDSRMRFMESIYATGGYLHNIKAEEIKSLKEENFSFEEIKRFNYLQTKGIKSSRLEALKNSVLQEFQAYSTDSLLRIHVDLKHEIPLQE